ncbi:MAG: hypothetical protein WAU45_13550 [Blastocatellia bacterium]
MVEDVVYQQQRGRLRGGETPIHEAELEQAIITKPPGELGKGFAFVARQQRISAETPPLLPRRH